MKFYTGQGDDGSRKEGGDKQICMPYRHNWGVQQEKPIHFIALPQKYDCSV